MAYYKDCLLEADCWANTTLESLRVDTATWSLELDIRICVHLCQNSHHIPCAKRPQGRAGPSTRAFRRQQAPFKLLRSLHMLRFTSLAPMIYLAPCIGWTEQAQLLLCMSVG